ncbi:hypothetical protein HK104_011003 [Borealophlyctis nickersoniae]|nr:hypothetical protein HK104_011003 [Borealophlyctis nickersoniae]
MPELPEVERARRLIHENLLEDTIVDTVDEIVYTGCTNTEFADAVTGGKIVDTGRRGKVFWIVLDKDVNPVLHFGMTGNLQLKGHAPLQYRDNIKTPEEWPPLYAKFILKFASGAELAFTDPRRLGRIRLISGSVPSQPPVSELGFDPLLDMPALEAFGESVRRRNMPIKALLLDQSFSAGVGNWVADEVLYQAHTHPAQNTQTLTDDELSSLHTCLASVVKTAVEVNADSRQFPPEWLFHYRWGKGKKSDGPPKMPDGGRIVFETVGGRTTAVVPTVQKLRKSKVKRNTKASNAKVKTEVKDKVKDEVDDSQEEDSGSVERPLRATRASTKRGVDSSLGISKESPSPKKRRRSTASDGVKAAASQPDEQTPVVRRSSRLSKTTVSIGPAGSKTVEQCDYQYEAGPESAVTSVTKVSSKYFDASARNRPKKPVIRSARTSVKVSGSTGTTRATFGSEIPHMDEMDFDGAEGLSEIVNEQ